MRTGSSRRSRPFGRRARSTGWWARTRARRPWRWRAERRAVDAERDPGERPHRTGGGRGRRGDDQRGRKPERAAHAFRVTPCGLRAVEAVTGVLTCEVPDAVTRDVPRGELRQPDDPHAGGAVARRQLGVLVHRPGLVPALEALQRRAPPDAAEDAGVELRLPAGPPFG